MAQAADRDVRESNFGAAEPFALGVEEELLLVDGQHQLVDRAAEVVRRAEPDAGDVSPELFQAMVEARSEICRDAAAATDELRGVRGELLRSGARIMGAGLHPSARPGEGDIFRAPRYALIEHSLQGVLRTPICGQHIHVGMPDEETAVRAYNGIRTHVPLLNALAANSPFWFGADSGLASARTVIFRSYPRAAMAPAFDDFADFRRVTQQVCDAGDLEDYTHIWWDVRLHPALGTIEVRAADSQFDLRRVAALAALVHCLARIEADRSQSGIPAREALAESSFQATRHGLNARLLDRSGRLVEARDLGRESLELAATRADELGCAAELAYIETMIERGSGAAIQRAVHAERGIDGLLEFLAEETSRL